MSKRIAAGLLVVGSILWAGATVAEAQGLQPAPDCIQYSSDHGRILAVNKCSPGGLYLKSDIDRCKYIGRSESWATRDNKLYVCSPNDAGTPPSTGSA